MFTRKLTYTIIGSIELLLSFFWLYHFIKLYKIYQTPGLLFSFILPGWLIYSSCFLSTLGIILALVTLFKKINATKSIIIASILFIIGMIINLFYYNISNLFS